MYVVMYLLFSHYNKQDFQNRYFISDSRDFLWNKKRNLSENKKKLFSFHEKNPTKCTALAGLALVAQISCLIV